MDFPYGKYPELAPPEAACANCAKGRNGRKCCPAADKVPKCAAWQRLTESDKPKPPEQIRLPISTASVSALVPALITPDMAELAEQILRVWDINLGKGDFSQYSIINRNNPALRPLFPRFQTRAYEMGARLAEDMLYILCCLRMFIPGVRNEYAKYCEQVELDRNKKKPTSR